MGNNEENVAAWREWRNQRTDEDFRTIAKGSKLERKAIYTACGFARSVLGQNPVVEEELGELEKDLRTKGILAPMKDGKSFNLVQEDMTPKAADKPNPKAEAKEKDLLAQKNQKIKRLEEREVVLQNEVRDLREENKGLKEKNANLERQLSAREDHFLETGRQAR